MTTCSRRASGTDNQQRLYEELTPPPTEENAWVLVTTYAGFTGESTLLETMYRRGLAGQRVDAALECYETEGLFMFWSHTARQPWQTEQYYAEQARSLRPATFARLHRNEWVTAESALIPPEVWDTCVDAAHAPLPPSPMLVCVAGIDASYRRDCSAVVALAQQLDGRLVLVRHRIWTPRPDVALNLEETIERYVLTLADHFRLVRVLADPFQMVSSIARLQAAGVPIEAYPQTVAHTTTMATVLLDLLRDRQLVLYPDAELRAHALATVGVESPRGFRIAKEKASRKIDGVVALAMAAVAATEAFAADAAAAARVAAAMDPLQIARELRQIRRAMPGLDARPLPDALSPGALDDLLVGDGLDDSDDDYKSFNPWPIPRQRSAY